MKSKKPRRKQPPLSATDFQSEPINRGAHPNRILAALSPDDLALLASDLRQETLTVRDPIEKRDTRITRIFFVQRGIISVVAVAGKTEVEVGLVGCEGMTGMPIIHGDDRSPHSTYVQVAGSAVSIASDEFKAAVRQSETLQRIFLKYAQAFMIQTNHTAIANAKANINQRLARWILMAHDRVPAKEVRLTHEFLALMLGVRRPGVTTAIHELARHALIENTRNGVLTIVDRAGLEDAAGPYYGVPEKEYKRLIG